MSNTLLALRADDLLEKVQHFSVWVTRTSTKVVEASETHRFLLLINDGNTDIYISIGSAAEAHKGIRINKNGGSLQFSLCTSSMPRLDIYAVQESASPVRLLVTVGW